MRKLTIEYTQRGQIKDHVSSVSIPLTEDNIDKAMTESVTRLFEALRTRENISIKIG